MPHAARTVGAAAERLGRPADWLKRDTRESAEPRRERPGAKRGEGPSDAAGLKVKARSQLTSPHRGLRVPARSALLLLQVERHLAAPPAAGVRLAVALTERGSTLRLDT